MIRLHAHIQHWPLKTPFRIAGASMNDVPVIVLTLVDDQGKRGQAEAAGIDYDGETPESMLAKLRAIDTLPDSCTADELMQRLPRGGARNALDCALWDLRAKQQKTTVSALLGLPAPRPLLTAMTIGLGSDAETRVAAHATAGVPLLKLKVSADRHLDAIAIVRDIHPDTRLVVDANGAWSFRQLRALLPALEAARIELIEQPLPRGEDAVLDGFTSSIPLAADESCTDSQSLEALIDRYQFATIKLDKCGGLSEALRMIRIAQQAGLGLMVGNMCGSSLAMAPAFLVGQYCEYVDLDGPLLQSADIEPAMRYDRQLLYPPQPALWG